MKESLVKKDDIKIYKDDVERLLFCDSLELVQDELAESKLKWSAAFKVWNEWQEVPNNVMALCLYKIQVYYMYEFCRGSCGMGNYTLKDIKESYDPPPPYVEKSDTFSLSQTALAKHCVANGRVSRCPEI
ncbi:unnamed protein product [Clavelina lepadiformis]|uniref:Uncharacterized protein n=1 Tax=Clavelina lepadiformis TaxID=159417 RepID=A0ABP0FHV3_CLALP